ncbi:hypothetical protein SAMN05216188_109213 [Lentzea xinjiangensis]|uniref:Uncharacterized protein n=1 Tax=Lentzea xinjiangensis TaxID=402600 RepID=A0A1H9MSH9_9PSEU|nr:hypothetical protein [Lentzea xinjiangensis]SER26437.1 hypothetical protein SAMN05216188_109213 [Lentzea xinjiangensis]
MDETLREAVLRRLALLEEAAEDGEAEALVSLARAEIHRLADGWRLVLAVHQPGEDGRCKACPGWLRRRRWPCQVWNTAHRHLIGEGLPHRERRRPLRNPFTRPGAVEPPGGTPAGTTTKLPILSDDPPVVHRAPVVSRPKHALPE